MIGLYAIKNKQNKKIYIGKSSVDIQNRLSTHKSLLNRNKHYNKHLQKSWNKYGEENFSFEIILDCEGLTDKEILEEEMKMISKFNSTNIAFGYNLTKGGEGILGYKHSETTKKKLGIYSTGRTHSDKTKDRIKDVLHTKFSNGDIQYKLSAKDVYEIKHLLAYTTYTFSEISDMYNVTSGNIHHIYHLKTFPQIACELNSSISTMRELREPLGNKSESSRLTMSEKKKGDKNPKAILSEEDVVEIKKFLKFNETYKTLSEKYKFLSNKYNVSISTIKNIKLGIRWGHIIV